MERPDSQLGGRVDEAGGRNSNADRSPSWWALGCFLAGYSVMHHSGLFGSAEVGRGTRLADWIDLATPFVVLLPLLAFMFVQHPQPNVRLWILAAVGSLLYVQGHGIHLSANSISNVAVSGIESEQTLNTIHLWDEVVGHYLWYLGLAAVITACSASVRGRSLGIPLSALVVGGAICGLTWATNGLEGGTAVASLALSFVAFVPAVRRDRGLAAALAAGGATAAVILATYGLWNGGFPQPSAR